MGEILEEVKIELTPEQQEEFDFLKKFHKKILEFAEKETISGKLTFIDTNEDVVFKDTFKKVYHEYYKYLVITHDKEKLINAVNSCFEKIDIYKGVMQTDDDFIFYGDIVLTYKEYDKLHKRVSKINKKLFKKYQYRIRESYYDNYMVNSFIKLYNITKHPTIIALLSVQVDAIIIRQINRLKFHRFSTPMDDLIQDLRAACLSAIEKFDPSKGKPGRESFNYFSHICKKAGYMTTVKQSDRLKWETSESDIFTEEGSFYEAIESDKNYTDYYENILLNENRDAISNFYNYFYNLFKGKERFQLLLQILIHYVLFAKNLNFKKNLFVKYAKSHGFTGAFVNKFLSIIKTYKKEFMVHDLSK